MKLRIIVEVVDERSRKGTRRRREVKVPDRVLNVHKALCEDRRDLRAFVADDVISGALAAITGQQSTNDIMSEALLLEPAPAPVRVNTGGILKQPQQAAPVRHNKVESFLGLDVIEHMDGLEHQAKQMEQASQPAPIPGQQQQSKSTFEWGSIGFGPDRGR